MASSEARLESPKPRRHGPNPQDRSPLLMNTTVDEHEEFERWATEEKITKVALFRRMMSRERKIRAGEAKEA